MVLVYLQGYKAINLPSNSGTFYDPPKENPYSVAATPLSYGLLSPWKALICSLYP